MVITGSAMALLGVVPFSQGPFEDWHREHPRLPAPAVDDFSRLKRLYSGYLRRQQYLADKGDLYAIALLGRMEPDRIDTAGTVRRLLQLQYQGRGHGQAMPVALFYDWVL